MKKIYILLVAIMVTTMSFGQDIAVNGGFENWSAGVPDSWSTIDFNTTDLVENTTIFIEGTKSAQINLMTQDQAVTDMRQLLTVVAGKTYDVSLQVYATDNQARARIFTGDWAGSAYSDETLLNQWQTITFAYTATADGDVEFGIRFYDGADWVAGPSVFYIDDFKVVAQAGPGMVISTPTDGEIITSGNDVVVSYAVSNFNVATSGNGDGHVHYTVGAIDAMAYDTADITLSGLADGNYTLYMELVDDADNPIDPAVNSTVNFTVSGYTPVATIAELRASALDGLYELTGEAFINMAIDYRNQKWIQDDTAGILIYDYDGNITAGVRGDGVSAVKGQLVEYNGLLEFKPMEDATITSPSTLTIEPQVVTIAEILANGDDYEAELVKIQNVTLTDYDDGGSGDADGTFQNGESYPMTQGTDNLMFRTNFYDVDYTGTALPTVAKDIVGLVGQYNDFQFTARDLADFSDVAAVTENNIEGFNMYPNPVNGNVLNITTSQNLDKNVQIFDILGKQVYSKTITGTTVNVSNLNAGLYLIKVEEAGKLVTRKLVIK